MYFFAGNSSSCGVNSRQRDPNRTEPNRAKPSRIVWGLKNDFNDSERPTTARRQTQTEERTDDDVAETSTTTDYAFNALVVVLSLTTVSGTNGMDEL